MQTDETQGTFEGILEPHTASVKAIARALRRLLLETNPDLFETPRGGEKCTTYGIGPRKRSQAYANIMPLKSAVNLGFYHGVALPDPKGLLEGTGKRARHAKVADLRQARDPALVALVRAAVRERAAAVPPA